MTDQEVMWNIVKYRFCEDDKEKQCIIESMRAIDDDQLDYMADFAKCREPTLWWASAEIIVALGYPRVKHVLHKLYEHLYDLNWPGSENIWNFLLNKLDRNVMIESLEKALRRVYIHYDPEAVYWLSEFAQQANLCRDDFPEENNAYDLVEYYFATHDEDGIENDRGIDLLYEWGYPRILQFVPYLVTSLTGGPEHSGWNKQRWEHCYGVLELIPENERELEIKKALAQRYFVGKINDIGYLKTKMPHIEDGREGIIKYLAQ